MSISDLTVDTIESFLRALRSGNAAAEKLLSVDTLFMGEEDAPEERALVLFDRLEKIVNLAYTGSRTHEGLTGTPPGDKSGVFIRVKEDYSRGNPELEAWSALYYRYISPVFISVEDLAKAANVVPQQFRRRLNLSLALLVQTLIRQHLEQSQRQTQSLRHLPLPEASRLVGVGRILDQLAGLFQQSDGPLLVSLEGIGGIGKTALARAFVSQPDIAAEWSTILWVSARQSSLADDGSMVKLADPATTLEDISIRLAEQLGLSNLKGKTLTERLEGLRAALANKKALAVIDNLETVEEYQALIPAVAKLAGASRFLITTRQTLRQFPFVHVIPLNELTEAKAYDLLHAELVRRGRTAGTNRQHFTALYEVIGGIPLALKLAAAQLTLRPLADILSSIRGARSGTDGLYHYLYWQTWQNLSDSSRRVLLSFLTADPEGEDLDYLLTMSGQDEGLFYQSLQELDQFSLLETGGDAVRPLFRLHRLTVTFLQTDILKRW